MKCFWILFFVTELIWSGTALAEAPDKICSPTMLRIHKTIDADHDPAMEICNNAGKYEDSLLPDSDALPSGQFRSGEKDTFSYHEFMKTMNTTLNQISTHEKCPVNKSKKPAQVARPNLILEKTAVGTIPLSIVSEDEANQIFKDFANDPKYAYKNPKEGCWARAHLMDQELEKKGLRAGKVFIEGSLRYFTPNAPNGKYVDWSFHVAPVLAVQTAKGVQLRVIDPSTADKPLPMNEWTQQMVPVDKYKIPAKIYITDRFAFFALRHQGLDRNLLDPAKGRWHIAETKLAEMELRKRKKEQDLAFKEASTRTAK